MDEGKKHVFLYDGHAWHLEITMNGSMYVNPKTYYKLKFIEFCISK